MSSQDLVSNFGAGVIVTKTSACLCLIAIYNHGMAVCQALLESIQFPTLTYEIEGKKMCSAHSQRLVFHHAVGQSVSHLISEFTVLATKFLAAV